MRLDQRSTACKACRGAEDGAPRPLFSRLPAAPLGEFSCALRTLMPENGPLAGRLSGEVNEREESE
jgi:hypothetical protein